MLVMNLCPSTYQLAQHVKTTMNLSIYTIIRYSQKAERKKPLKITMPLLLIRSENDGKATGRA